MRYECIKCRKVFKSAAIPKQCPKCGDADALVLAAGTEISGFRIVKVAGRGSSGIVYLSEQINLDRKAALKVLLPDLVHDRDFLDAFVKEARVAANLNHPNIVQAYDAGVSKEGFYYFAMEYVEGRTLDEYVEKEHPSWRLLTDIAVKVADAMDYAWKSKKMCHGDIKPANIMISNTGEVKLTDFGLAHLSSDPQNSDCLMLTPMYAAPELIKGDRKRNPVRVDIYAFGATFYDVLSGGAPFDDDDAAIVMQRQLSETPVALCRKSQRLPSALGILIDSMLEKDPLKRPGNWEQVNSALEHARRIRTPKLNEIIFRRHYKVAAAAVLSAAFAMSCVIYGFWLEYLAYELKHANVDYVEQYDAEHTLLLPADNRSGPSTYVMTPERRNWELLQKKLAQMEPAAAVASIESFSGHSNPDPELYKRIKPVLEQYKKQAAEAVAEQVQIKKFLGQQRQLITALDQLEFKKMSENELAQWKLKIAKMFAASDTFAQNAGRRDALAPGTEKLRETMLRINSLQKEIRRRNAAERRRQAQAEERRKQQMLRRQQAMKNYFQVLKAFSKLPAEQKTSDGLDAAMSSSELSDLPESYSKKLGSMKKSLDKQRFDFSTLFVAKRENVLKRYLPWRIHNNIYRVHEINGDYAKVICRMAKGAISYQRIYWENLSDKQFAALLVYWLLKQRVPLSDSEREASAMLLLKTGNYAAYRYLKVNYGKMPAFMDDWCTAGSGDGR